MTSEKGARSDPERIKGLGWRQGSVMPVPLTAKLKDTSGHLIPLTENDVCIVMSHDCDVTHKSLENEPWTEILRATQAQAPDGNLSYGKNPRRFQFELRIGDESQLMEVSTRDRFFIDRSILGKESPDENRTCSRKMAEHLADWLSRRYVRAAFPDEFNQRMAPALSQIKKALKHHGENVSAVLISCSDWTELTHDRSYDIVLVLLLPTELYDSPKLREKPQQALDMIQSAIKSKAVGINIVEGHLVAENGISYEDFKISKRLDFDYLSGE